MSEDLDLPTERGRHSTGSYRNSNTNSPRSRRGSAEHRSRRSLSPEAPSLPPLPTALEYDVRYETHS